MSKKSFQKIYVEISNICNLQCTFCPVVERDKKVMDLEKLREILLQVKPLAERVCFHVMGEPLNHPHFVECVELAQELEVPLEITTNGTLLTEGNQQALLTPTIQQINFSLQSFIDNFPNAKPESYFAKILQFTQLALEKRPELYINFRFWNLQQNRNSQEINEYFLTQIEKYHGSTLSPL